MSKETLSLGFVILILGIVILIITNDLWISIIPILLGLILILFHKEENKIEKRKDIKTKKTKKTKSNRKFRN